MGLERKRHQQSPRKVSGSKGRRQAQSPLTGSMDIFFKHSIYKYINILNFL